MDAAEHSHATHFAQAKPQEGSCCCNEEQCSLPAKPDCCACCPSAPLDPAAVANAKLHAEAAYTGLNRTDPDAIWYYQGWILGGQFSFIKGLTEAVKQGQLVISGRHVVRRRAQLGYLEEPKRLFLLLRSIHLGRLA